MIKCTAVVKGDPPKGTVTWSQVGGPGKVAFPPSPCKLAKSGKCTVTLKGTGAGTVSIQAVYSGDSKDQGSTSNTIGLGVTKITPKLLARCAPNPVAVGQPTTCTAIVIGFSPTGLVTWTQSGGTGGIIPTSQTCTLAPTSATTSNCTVSFSVNGPGIVDIKVAYSGDSNNNPATILYKLKVA